MSDKIGKKENIVLVFLKEFIRVRGVVNWSAISFIGFILGMSSLDFSSYMVPLLVFIISTFCILSFTFAINNFFDVDSDRENPRKRQINAIASGKISKQTGVFLNITFIVIPLVVSIFFKLEVFLICALILAWMGIYSVPPLRLKGRPGIDVLWHFFAFFLLVMWGSSISGSIGLINFLVAISLGIFSCTAQIWNHILDYSFDKSSGTTTFAVWAGLDIAKTTLKILVIIHMIFLIPLILLYSLSYYSTIALLIGGAMISLLAVRRKKEVLGSSFYYFPGLFGGVVYLSVVLHHINVLLGESPIGLLPFVGIL